MLPKNLDDEDCAVVATRSTASACSAAAVVDLAGHPDFDMAAPIPDHFLPLLDLTGLADADGTSCGVLVDGCADGSLSMTAYALGADFPNPGGVTERAAAVPASDDVPPEATNAPARSSTRW